MTEDEKSRPGQGGSSILTDQFTAKNGPFAIAASAYLESGWNPIPVGGKSFPIAGFTGKKLEQWDAIATEALITQWAPEHGYKNIGHRHVGTVAIDIDHGYGGKWGADTLAAMVEKFGPLPATYSSTARGDDSESRQYFFRIPAGRERYVTGSERRIKSDFGRPVPRPDGSVEMVTHVELIHRGHRYSVIWPSVHPDTAQVYRFYGLDGNLLEYPPNVEQLPDLPSAWLDYIAPLPVDESIPVAQSSALDHLAGSVMAGEPWTPAAAEREIAKWLEKVAESVQGQGQNTILNNASLRIGRFVGGGFLTREEAEERITEAFQKIPHARKCTNCPSTMRSGLDKGVTEPMEMEVGTDIVTRPLNLPDEFWDSRPMLKHIRNAAHSRCVSADLVLYSTLARLSAMSHHELGLETVLGAGSLNLFAAVVGPSGTGKSAGVRAASGLLPLPSWLDEWDFRDGLPIGSGEGLAETYMGMKQKGTGETDKDGKEKTKAVRAQVRHNALVYVDEGQTLTEQQKRQGATIGPALRQAWVGSTLGQQNAVAETTRVIKEDTYSLGLVIGYQMSTALALLADVEPGTPQRFIWCSAIDPNIPEYPIEHPGELSFLKHPLTEVEGVKSAFSDAALFDNGAKPRTGRITFPEEVNAWLWGNKRARARGEVQDADLDSHKMLMLCKLAALVALLDQRMEVSAEDWKLAGQMWRTSCAVRDAVVKHGEATQQNARQEAEDHRVRMRLMEKVAEAGVPQDIARVSKWVVAKLSEKGPQTEGALRSLMNKRDRHHLSPALAECISLGQVRETDGVLSVVS